MGRCGQNWRAYDKKFVIGGLEQKGCECGDKVGNQKVTELTKELVRKKKFK